MTNTFLGKVYTPRSSDDTRELYDAWSTSYETEVGDNGYVTHFRCAEALARHMDDMTAPILDFGCGTGLSGVALAQAGFTAIDGVDLSADMLKGAAEKSAYRSLKQVEAGEIPVTNPGDYAAICAIGVIGAGAAPIDTFDMIMGCLMPGGRMVLSFNDHALAIPENQARLDHWISAGQARLLFQEYGAHLPGIDLKSNVYVLEKL